MTVAWKRAPYLVTYISIQGYLLSDYKDIYVIYLFTYISKKAIYQRWPLVMPPSFKKKCHTSKDWNRCHTSPVLPLKNFKLRIKVNNNSRTLKILTKRGSKKELNEMYLSLPAVLSGTGLSSYWFCQFSEQE